MERRPVDCVRALALTLLLVLPNLAAGEQPQPAQLIAPCLECHDHGEGAPANRVLLGSHGIEGEDMAGRRGCLDCHGDSEQHIANPRQASPDVSFGPRWSADPAAQDAPCLACHEDDVARDWRHALHMVNNLTCITCHDIHAEQDQVLVADQQFTICTTCHKAQKSGIHDLGSGGAQDPPCSACHDPHNHEAAAPRMHANDSAGCVFCHHEEQMETLAALNPRAGNFHRMLDRSQRDCLDCHQGIAHAPEDSAPPLQPMAVPGRAVTLFYPGHASRQWLEREHPGSQPLRQGTDCQRCHRGDEPGLGAAMAPGLEPSSRVLGIAFSSTGDRLRIELNWQGSREDRQLALMWGGPANPEFARGGCFAACHEAPPGQATRLIVHQGTDPLDASMGGFIAPGEAVELWRVQLDTGEVTTAPVRSSVENRSGNQVAASTKYEDGNWQVQLEVELGRASEGLHFARGNRYTFGLAVHGARASGREHLVSLPMSIGFDTEDTDFSVP